MLAVNVGWGDSIERLPAYRDLLDLTFPLLLNTEGTSFTSNVYGVTSCPASFFIDKEGVIRYRKGAIGYDQTLAIVDELLSE